MLRAAAAAGGRAPRRCRLGHRHPGDARRRGRFGSRGRRRLVVGNPAGPPAPHRMCWWGLCVRRTAYTSVAGGDLGRVLVVTLGRSLVFLRPGCGGRDRRGLAGLAGLAGASRVAVDRRRDRGSRCVRIRGVVAAGSELRSYPGRLRRDLRRRVPGLGRGCSFATRITPGQAADTRQLIPLLHQVWAPRPGDAGRPRMRPDSVTGDMAYSSRANRRALGHYHRHPRAQRPDRQPEPAGTTGRPPTDLRHHRLQAPQPGIERGFNRRKHWRGLATRYDKLATHFQATLNLVATLDWLPAIPDQHDLRDRTSRI